MTDWRRATSLAAILTATRLAARGKADRPEVARFLMDAEREGLRLQRALRRPLDDRRSWHPGPVERFFIRDPKPREITVAPFRDRVVHHVLCATFEGALERYAVRHSYACWPGRGQHRALRQCQRFSRKAPWALKGDISSYFSSIPHEPLLRAFARLEGCSPLVGWVARAIGGSPRDDVLCAGRGLAIGALTSQHLANFYLATLDHWLTDGLGYGRYLRYMDDFVVFGERVALRALVPRIRAFLADRLDLRLNERQTQVGPVRDGVRFLGFRVFPSQIRVSPTRWRRFRRRERGLMEAFALGQIDDEELGRRLSSQYAHLEAFDTHQARRSHLLQVVRRGRDRQQREPGHPRWLVEERTAQRAGREPQQERALQPQRQPGFSCRELNHQATRASEALVAGPVGVASRSGFLCPGIDQVPVPCGDDVEGSAFRSVTAEPPQPGGGVSRVAAGRFARHRP